MCIGQDIRGNIKLSHKATLPSPGRFKTNNVAEGSVASAKEKAKIWAPVWNVASTEEKSNSSSELPIGGKHEASGAKSKSTASQIPVFLVRSVAECDEEEKSINKDLSSKGTTVNNGVQSDQKSKSRRSKNMADSPSSESGPLPYKNVKMSKPSTQKADDKATVTAKDLKLGTKVTAKVYQVCAHGLVLELGGGLRGMYQFKENNKSDFNIGDELRVVCSSFNSKGVPVLSSVNDE